jgi:predicted transcriptional regulator
MPVEKISISLPQELAQRLDELAKESGVSRSSLVQEAVARYVASRTADAEAERRHASVDRAIAGLDEVASAWGEDERQGVEYLADIRDTGARADGSEGPQDG